MQQQSMQEEVGGGPPFLGAPQWGPLVWGPLWGPTGGPQAVWVGDGFHFCLKLAALNFAARLLRLHALWGFLCCTYIV